MPHLEQYLACDAGGTNTTIAIVQRNRDVGLFEIVERFRLATADLPSIEEGIRSVIPHPETYNGVCITGAGPVFNRVCQMTNLPLRIDARAVEAAISVPTAVVNDFLGVSYGLPQLQIEARQIAPLTFHGEAPPTPHGTVRAAIGAGTGLGVGFLTSLGPGEYYAYPSEAGHSSSFAPYDEISRELYRFVEHTTGDVPGAELFVSGQGLGNTLAFFQSQQMVPSDSPLATIPPDRNSGAAISEAARAGDRAAKEIMNLFVRNYAVAAATAALHFLPFQGLFLAGGIVTKNHAFFEQDDQFMNAFARNYTGDVAELLRKIPIYMVLDYEVSLYGGAYIAAHNLYMEDN